MHLYFFQILSRRKVRKLSKLPKELMNSVKIRCVVLQLNFLSIVFCWEIIQICNKYKSYLISNYFMDVWMHSHLLWVWGGVLVHHGILETHGRVSCQYGLQAWRSIFCATSEPPRNWYLSSNLSVQSLYIAQMKALDEWNKDLYIFFDVLLKLFEVLPKRDVAPEWACATVLFIVEPVW